MDNQAEWEACTPISVSREKFNPQAMIPYGCQTDHIFQAMNDFCLFLGFINRELYTKQISRLETMLMAANFSSIVVNLWQQPSPNTAQLLLKIVTTMVIQILFHQTRFPIML